MSINEKCPLSHQNIKCSFLDYVQLLMIGGLVDGLESHPAPFSSQKKWNAHFWITFNFWWSARLVEGLEPCLPCLSNQKNEMLIFGLCSTPDDWPGWSMDSNPVCHSSPTKNMKCSFLDYVQLLMIGRAGQYTLTPSATALQPKNEMLIFGSCSTSDDLPGWSMDSNPICHPSSAKKMKCSFLDYVQLLIIGQAIWGKNVDQNAKKPKKGPLSHQKIKCSFLDYIQLLMKGQAIWAKNVNWKAIKQKSPPKSSKNKMFIFGLCSTSDDRLSDPSRKCQLKRKKMKKAPQVIKK